MGRFLSTDTICVGCQCKDDLAKAVSALGMQHSSPGSVSLLMLFPARITVPPSGEGSSGSFQALWFLPEDVRAALNLKQLSTQS